MNETICLNETYVANAEEVVQGKERKYREKKRY